MKTFMKLLLVAVLSWPVLACGDLYTGVFKNMGIILLAPPALNDLGPLADSGSILVPRPTLATDGHLDTTIAVYCGIDGEISVTGHEVSGIYTQGSLDTAAGGFVFAGLDMNKTYRIIVVARNAMGYSVKQATRMPYNPIAVAVYGQGGDFTTSNPNKDGISAKSLVRPASIAINDHGVYIADSRNYRVLYYAGNSTEASLVYGQGGSFSTAINNNGGVSAASMSDPYSVAIYAGDVYITDPNNHRLLFFEWDSTTATRVYGQGGDFTTQALNYPSLAESGLYIPYAIATDGVGIYIADAGNNRVLYYAGTSTTATRVYGQGGNFATSNDNKGGISASSLYYPCGLAVDAGGIYIADYQNHRVLYYEGTSTTATRVYGQGASGTNFTSNGSSTSATGLNGPTGVALDASGVYIADHNNNRVLHYWGTSVTATGVYGQGGSLTSAAINQGAGAASPTATSLYHPWGIAVYSDRVYITDWDNHRVLRY